jgi:hypothetical protein
VLHDDLLNSSPAAQRDVALPLAQIVDQISLEVSEGNRKSKGME